MATTSARADCIDSQRLQRDWLAVPGFQGIQPVRDVLVARASNWNAFIARQANDIERLDPATSYPDSDPALIAKPDQ